jgi:hypothetical protein
MKNKPLVPRGLVIGLQQGIDRVGGVRVGIQGIAGEDFEGRLISRFETR